MTLTNWVRLNNAPLLLPRASAVQWNDNIFVLARDGTALLYHTKDKFWSMLPQCPNNIPVSDHLPLVNYKGDILAVSKHSGAKDALDAFDKATSSWKMFSGPKLVQEIVHMAVSHDILRVYAKKQSHFFLFTLTTEGWKENNIGVNQTASKLLLTSDHIFVETAEGIYRQKINSTSNSETQTIETPKRIAPPPHYKEFTLHVLKDTLLSFGGRDKDYQPTSDVLRYNPDTDTWECAGYMRSCRYNAAVATVQQGTTTEVYVLGGEFGSTSLTMTPKLQACTRTHAAESQQAPAEWDCSTSIVEKCILSD